MPEAELKHITIRPAKYFSKFRVIRKRSHLSEADQKIVKRKIGSKKALYTVGKFKRTHKAKAPKGKTGKPLAWALQKIMIKKERGKVPKKKSKKKKKVRKTYYCTKCKQRHRKNSKVGRSHKKHQRKKKKKKGK